MDDAGLTRPMAVIARDLALAYGETQVLNGVDVNLAQGRTLALLGPSGCGKTTLLRLLAGLLAPSRGIVSISGTIMADSATGRFVPPERRGLGMVFQDYALWPHMSVAANVAFPLEMAGLARSETDRRVMTALDRVGLADLAKRNPGDLSGGQQQRVAIARAIVAEPKLVLFDEPLSNLDRELRESLAVELAELLSSLSLSAVYVTHDQSEAFAIADEVAIMQRGRIIQLAEPRILVAEPENEAVADFLKLGTIIDTERRDGAWRVSGTDFVVADAASGPSNADRARVVLGRAALKVRSPEAVSTIGTVTRSLFRGDFNALSVALQTGSREVVVEVVSALHYAVGEKIGLEIEAGNLRWFPKN